MPFPWILEKQHPNMGVDTKKQSKIKKSVLYLKNWTRWHVKFVGLQHATSLLKMHLPWQILRRDAIKTPLRNLPQFIWQKNVFFRKISQDKTMTILIYVEFLKNLLWSLLVPYGKDLFPPFFVKDTLSTMTSSSSATVTSTTLCWKSKGVSHNTIDMIISKIRHNSSTCVVEWFFGVFFFHHGDDWSPGWLLLI